MEYNRDKELARVNQLDMNIRGTYLANVVPIEELVKEIVSYHFCATEERRKQLVSLILHGENFTFSFGINILHKILELHYPDLKNQHPTLYNELEKIRKFRNKVAHSILDTSDEFLRQKLVDTIRLKSYDDKGDTNFIPITHGEASEKLKSCLNVFFALTYIRKEVRDRNFQNNPNYC